MSGMNIWRGFYLVSSLALSGCEEPPSQAYGQLESAGAGIEIVSARLAELEAGTRP